MACLVLRKPAVSGAPPRAHPVVRARHGRHERRVLLPFAPAPQMRAVCALNAGSSSIHESSNNIDNMTAGLRLCRALAVAATVYVLFGDVEPAKARWGLPQTRQQEPVTIWDRFVANWRAARAQVGANYATTAGLLFAAMNVVTLTF